MKFSLLFFIAILFQMHAENGYAQRTRLSLNLNNVSVMDAINEIESKSDFKFFYSKEDLDSNRKVSLNVRRKKIEDVLLRLFPTGTMSYEVIEKQVVLSPTTFQPDDLPKSVIKTQQDPITVTGLVTNTEGVPLPGVSVVVKGTSRGVATNFDGNYQIVVPNGQSILVFSSIGYTEQEVSVGTKITINVTLEESVSQLDEVVLNAGYYKTEKKIATGNIAKVDAKIIEKQPVANPLATLQGRMAGVNITQNGGSPGSGFEVQIRGTNSIRPGGNQPLYIVDGMPFSNESLGSRNASGTTLPLSLRGDGDGLSALNSINPADIESIEVLKDADATAIYGSRGANGVVLITTKRGREGKTQFDINLFTGMSTVTRKVDLLNTEQYLEMRQQAFENDGVDPTALPPFATNDFLVYDQNRDTDWQNELIGNTAYVNSIQASVSGGSANTQFVLNGGFYNETTVTPGDFGYERFSGHAKVNHKSDNNKFRINFSANYVADNNNLVRFDFTRNALRLAPNAPALFDDDGNINFADGTFNNNPATNLEGEYLSRTNNLITNALLEYEILKGLSIRTNLGYNSIRLDETQTLPSTRFNPASGLGSEFSVFVLNGSSRQSWIFEPQLDWNTTLGKGKLNILAGATFQEQTDERLVTSGTGFPDNSLITNLGAATTLRVPESGNTEYRYNAVFGRINYNWDGKYILNLTGRRDGSSRFGPGRQFANFGAVGAAWIFSEEDFVMGSSFLSFGKLRGSYGTTGSDQFADYQFLDTFSSVSDDYVGITGLQPTQLFNPNLSWEINKKLEFALELGLFNDRILFNAAYFRNRSSNQLIGIPLSGLTGFNSIQANFDATVENRGWELDLNTINLRKGNFIWRTGFNITIPKTELVEFPGLEQSTFANELVVGESLNIVRTYESLGVNPETGLYEFTDFNDDGVISAPDDRQGIQRLDPEFFGGLSNSISYKGFELDFLFQFVKQTGVNYNGFLTSQGGPSNIPVELLENRWQQPGDMATYQRYTIGLNPQANAAQNFYISSDAAYSNASFIRLQNISLSYQLSEKWTKGFKARFYLQGQNLLTITDYFGLDPENQNPFFLPPLRTITLGTQFTF